MEIVPLLPIHARDVAYYHISGISAGFISSLGIEFVTALYEEIAESKVSFGFVAQEGEKILGFVAFTTNLNALYKSIVLKKGLRFAVLVASQMSRWTRIKRLFETLFYPERIKKLGLPSAELLSIAVAKWARGKRLATELTRAGFTECAKRQIEKLKVLVGADNEPANKLYLKCGFELVGQIDNHGVRSNIYIAATDATIS